MSRRRDPNRRLRPHKHTLRFVCSRGHPEREIVTIQVDPSNLDFDRWVSSDETPVKLGSPDWSMPDVVFGGDRPGVEWTPGMMRAKGRLRCKECRLDVAVESTSANAMVRELVKAGESRVELVDLARMLSRNSP